MDLYKVPHHGRDSTTGAGLIASLKPSIAVVTSSGAEPEIENALKQAGAETYYTVPLHDVVFESDGKDLTRVAEPAPEAVSEPVMGGV